MDYQRGLYIKSGDVARVLMPDPLPGTDTQVRWYRKSQGIVSGYCLIWNRPCFGSAGGQSARWKCVRSSRYKARRELPLLVGHNFAANVGEVLWRHFEIDNRGLKAYAIIRDVGMLAQLARGLLYFSPQISPVPGIPFDTVVKGGIIDEVSLVENPGTPITPRHALENEYARADLDLVTKAIDIATDGDLDRVAYWPVDLIEKTKRAVQGDYSVQAWLHQLKEHFATMSALEDSDATGELTDPSLLADAGPAPEVHLTPYEDLVGPQTGRARHELILAGIGA